MARRPSARPDPPQRDLEVIFDFRLERRLKAILANLVEIVTPHLVVNDLVTTGEGITALAQVAAESEAVVAGAAWFLSRSSVDVSEMVGAPVAAIGVLELRSWSPELCPLCASGLPLTAAIEIN